MHIVELNNCEIHTICDPIIMILFPVFRVHINLNYYVILRIDTYVPIECLK